MNISPRKESGSGCKCDAGGGGLDAEIHARAEALQDDEVEMRDLPDQRHVRLFLGTTT
jgi:O-acetyl-ADP-ribose deacetylase (regulator of RNase III)